MKVLTFTPRCVIFAAGQQGGRRISGAGRTFGDVGGGGGGEEINFRTA